MISHRWNLTELEAIKTQGEISKLVEKSDRIGEIKNIASVDISSQPGDKYDRIWATAVEFEFDPSEGYINNFNRPSDCSNVMIQAKFPYKPGLLSFREGPACVLALNMLKHKPDLIIFDAHGYSHPRKCGLASHLGVILDVPSIGCAKSMLLGNLGDWDGDTAPITEGSETIGIALRTKEDEEPVYVSIGHRVTLERAVKIVRWLSSSKYRLPITNMWAHHLANDFRRNSH